MISAIGFGVVFFICLMFWFSVICRRCVDCFSTFFCTRMFSVICSVIVRCLFFDAVIFDGFYW